MSCGVVTAAVALSVVAACGSDDDTAGADPEALPGVATDAPTAAESAADDELALGDPCELVPADVVAGVVGGEVTAELVNVGDGLPGATCAYTLAAGGTVSLSITPNGAGFFDTYKSQAEATGGVEPVDGLGDDGFVFQDVEVAARAGEAMVQLQVLTSATTAATGGVEVARAAVAAIDG